MLRDRVVNLTNPEEVQGFLAQNPTSVIFKAGTCHKTMQGFGFLQEKLEPREDLMIGIIRVVEARPASNLIAEMTGIVHHSPQVILFKDGQPVFERNNWDITPEELDTGFEKVPPTGGVVASQPKTTRSDLAPYKSLLEQYLTGVMSDRQFEYVYTNMFRDDASLRSREEVEVLNSIFGDVDQHMNMHVMMAGQTADYSVIKQRAEKVYEQLKVL
ncbi:MAG: monothiol bacilliredoxin BrxC family protein [Trueperaceae bacterium]